MALYNQAHETTVRRVAKSPRMRLVQKVLESRSDNSGSKWNTRSFWVEEVIVTVGSSIATEAIEEPPTLWTRLKGCVSTRS